MQPHTLVGEDRLADIEATWGVEPHESRRRQVLLPGTLQRPRRCVHIRISNNNQVGVAPLERIRCAAGDAHSCTRNKLLGRDNLHSPPPLHVEILGHVSGRLLHPGLVAVHNHHRSLEHLRGGAVRLGAALRASPAGIRRVHLPVTPGALRGGRAHEGASFLQRHQRPVHCDLPGWAGRVAPPVRARHLDSSYVLGRDCPRAGGRVDAHPGPPVWNEKLHHSDACSPAVSGWIHALDDKFVLELGLRVRVQVLVVKLLHGGVVHYPAPPVPLPRHFAHLHGALVVGQLLQDPGDAQQVVRRHVVVLRSHPDNHGEAHQVGQVVGHVVLPYCGSQHRVEPRCAQAEVRAQQRRGVHLALDPAGSARAAQHVVGEVC
mmetsp:Transcript_14655/g.28188  ORF Transcript_14655/g.28188 Transcript_14655/m.28188 type:complete len:375 (+) Transcript_14655:682-1806(+)